MRSSLVEAARGCQKCRFGRRGISQSVISNQKRHKDVIFTGIQPTGTPHLGNYLGLFQPFLELQKSSDPSVPLYLSIVGLHAITMPRDPKVLRRERREMLAALLACGVDPKRTCLFFQEDIPEHAELAWILNTLTPVGRLQRMTTWKSQLATRSATSTENIQEGDLKLGLLAYPVLQAADIMLYKSSIVPVGEDQTQHLELTRDIVQTFNHQYKSKLPLPQSRIVPTKRILNFRDPASKMSKSHPISHSRISITDSPENISKAVRSAVTDNDPVITYDPDSRPGLSNLLLILSCISENGSRSPEQIAELAREEGWNMQALKTRLSETLVEYLKPIRDEFERIKVEEGYLKEVAAQGRSKASEEAKRTMEEIRKIIGLDRI